MFTRCLTNFFGSCLSSLRYERHFCKCYQYYLKRYPNKSFCFCDELKVSSVAPQRVGGCTSPHILECFSYIMAMERELDTLHRLFIYTHLHTLTCCKRSQGISRSFDVFMTSSMSYFYIILCILHVLSKANILYCV